MDNRLTKKRLGNILSYDWGKIILIIAAICLVWSLAFTMGAPRASTGQIFTVFVSGNFDNAQSSGVILNSAREKNVFSYDVLDYSSRDIDKNMYGQIMMSVTSVQEGDIYITSDSQVEVEKHDSAFRTFIDGYGEIVYDINQLVKDAKDYCLYSNMVVEKNGGYMIDEEEVKKNFALRMKKDPRFRNNKTERYKEGEQQEILRIKTVWNNAVLLEDCLLNHPELKRDYKRYEQMRANDPENKQDYPENTEAKTYGLNIGLLTGKEEKISSLYGFTTKNEKGEVTSLTSDGVILCVFNFVSAQPHLQYETLGFVNYMIDRFSNFLNYDHKDLIG